MHIWLNFLDFCEKFNNSMFSFNFVPNFDWKHMFYKVKLLYTDCYTDVLIKLCCKIDWMTVVLKSCLANWKQSDQICCKSVKRCPRHRVGSLSRTFKAHNTWITWTNWRFLANLSNSAQGNPGRLIRKAHISEIH